MSCHGQKGKKCQTPSKRLSRSHRCRSGNYTIKYKKPPNMSERMSCQNTFFIGAHIAIGS